MDVSLVCSSPMKLPMEGLEKVVKERIKCVNSFPLMEISKGKEKFLSLHRALRNKGSHR
jgi:hypothetical protein